MRLDPQRVQSDTDPHDADLVMANPWGSAVQGEYFIVEPGGLSTGGRASQDRRWQISPRFGSFAIVPAADARLPITFDVSPAVGAGIAPLVVDLDLGSPTVADFVRVERTIEVGLEHISMHLLASFEPDPFGPDVVVYAIIENTGDTPEDILLKVSAPGHTGYSPQRAASTPVMPGRRLIKAFPFPDGRALLAGVDVTVGLTIRASGSRLRKPIRIDNGG